MSALASVACTACSSSRNCPRCANLNLLLEALRLPDLTIAELRSVQWLAGWGQDTVEGIAQLIFRSRQNA